MVEGVNKWCILARLAAWKKSALVGMDEIVNGA